MLKKSRIGRGGKVPHLYYVGDAVVGEGANIGAGTITCNYDGVAKHETRIGDGAFVGTNASLVAPITIGEGAYVAAGSVITKNVPPGALAVARGRQEMREGWAARKRKGRPAPSAAPAADAAEHNGVARDFREGGIRSPAEGAFVNSPRASMSLNSRRGY